MQPELEKFGILVFLQMQQHPLYCGYGASRLFSNWHIDVSAYSSSRSENRLSHTSVSTGSRLVMWKFDTGNFPAACWEKTNATNTNAPIMPNSENICIPLVCLLPSWSTDAFRLTNFGKLRHRVKVDQKLIAPCALCWSAIGVSRQPFHDKIAMLRESRFIFFHHAKSDTKYSNLREDAPASRA